MRDDAHPSSPPFSREEKGRRSVEQGSAQRGAGARLRDATVEPIMARHVFKPIHAHLRGQIPEGPSSALRRAHLRGCDRTGAHKNAGNRGAASRYGGSCDSFAAGPFAGAAA